MPKAVRYLLYGLATLVGLGGVLALAGIGYLLVGPSSPGLFSTPVPGHPGAFISADITRVGLKVEHEALLVDWVKPGGWFEAPQRQRILQVSGPEARRPAPPDSAVVFRWHGADTLELRAAGYDPVVVVVSKRQCWQVPAAEPWASGRRNASSAWADDWRPQPAAAPKRD